MSLLNDLLGDPELEAKIESLTLIPSSGGRFDVTVNGDLIFSKKEMGRHAEPGEVYGLIKTKTA